jgi:cholesterol transport system auxiliary component
MVQMTPRTLERTRAPRPRRGGTGRAVAGSVAALAAVLMLAGCGSAKPVRPDRFYALEPAALVGPAGPPAPCVLAVNDLAARGLLGGRQIVYRTPDEPLTVDRYEGLLWAEPPSRAIAQGLVSGLRAARVCEFVTIPADRARADYLLGGEVERFEHRPKDRPPRVLATINLALVRANDRQSMASRQYSGEEPVNGDTPEGMADAFNRLVARLVGEAVQDIQRVKGRLVRTQGP